VDAASQHWTAANLKAMQLTINNPCVEEEHKLEQHKHVTLHKGVHDYIFALPAPGKTSKYNSINANLVVEIYKKLSSRVQTHLSLVSPQSLRRYLHLLCLPRCPKCRRFKASLLLQLCIAQNWNVGLSEVVSGTYVFQQMNDQIFSFRLCC
jgi:hypothetical protein